jgi:hypothetical protein
VEYALLAIAVVAPTLGWILARPRKGAWKELPDTTRLPSPDPKILRLRASGDGWTAVLTFSPGRRSGRVARAGIPTDPCSRADIRFDREVPRLHLASGSARSVAGLPEVVGAAQGRFWMVETRRTTGLIDIEGLVTDVAGFVRGVRAFAEAMKGEYPN